MFEETAKKNVDSINVSSNCIIIKEFIINTYFHPPPQTHLHRGERKCGLLGGREAGDNNLCQLIFSPQIR